MKEITDRQLNNAIIKGIQEKKPTEVLRIDLRKIKDAPTDYMIIVQATSTTHVGAIADSVIDTVRNKFHIHPLSITGQENNEWIAIDYSGTFVHIMLPHMRDFYKLEELWADGVKKIIQPIS